LDKLTLQNQESHMDHLIPLVASRRLGLSNARGAAWAASLLLVIPAVGLIAAGDGSAGNPYTNAEITSPTLDGSGASGSEVYWDLNAFDTSTADPAVFRQDNFYGTNTIVGSANSYNILTVEAGSLLVGMSGSIGDGAVGDVTAGCHNSVTVTGDATDWSCAYYLTVGTYGSNNSLTVSDGASVEYGAWDPWRSVFYIGTGDVSNSNLGNNNSVAVTGYGSSITGSGGFANIYVGTYGSGNSLTVSNGASVSAYSRTYIGYGDSSNSALGNNNTFTVTGKDVSTSTSSTYSTNGSIDVGTYGSGNKLIVSDGGHVSLNTLTIGVGVDGTASFGSNNSVSVSGSGSALSCGSIQLGTYGSGNTLTITTGALVKTNSLTIGDATSVQDTDNYLQLNNGLLAIRNDDNGIAALLSAGSIKVWNGTTYIVGDSTTVHYFYCTTEAEVTTFLSTYLSAYDSSYTASELVNYTLVTGTAVPEPAMVALFGGMSVLVFVILRQRRAKVEQG
jgi:T5SS/PEP-CTERM-associated repeat protein